MHYASGGGSVQAAKSNYHDTVALAIATEGSHLMLALDSEGNVYCNQDGGNSWSP
jgi:hypothetical protein